MKYFCYLFLVIALTSCKMVGEQRGVDKNIIMIQLVNRIDLNSYNSLTLNTITAEAVGDANIAIDLLGGNKLHRDKRWVRLNTKGKTVFNFTTSSDDKSYVYTKTNITVTNGMTLTFTSADKA